MSDDGIKSEVTAEKRAMYMGWVPKDEWKGPEERWVPADQFVKNAEERLDYAKGSIKKMEQKMGNQEAMIERLTGELSSLKNDTAELVQFYKGSEERAYKKALRDIQARQKEAVRAGDEAAFDEASSDLNELIQQHPAVTGKQPGKDLDVKPKVDAASTVSTGNVDYDNWLKVTPTAYDDWLKENKWFESDAEMFDYAEKVDKMLFKRHGLSKTQVEHLEMITEEVKKKFPQNWENPKKRAAGAVEGGDVTPLAGGKHSYSALPPEAKTQCDKWTGKDGLGKTGTIPGMTREQYLKDFKWE